MGDIDPSLNLNAHIIHAFSKKVRTKLQSSVSHAILQYGWHKLDQQGSTKSSSWSKLRNKISFL